MAETAKPKEQPKGTDVIKVKPDIPAKYAGLVAVRQAVEEIEAFLKYGLLEKGRDYGVIPGTTKPMIFKPGLEMLCKHYHYAVEPTIDDTGTDFERGIFRNRVTMTGYQVDQVTGIRIFKGQGWGSCSSLESKYRWRWLKYYELPSDVPRNKEGKVDIKKAVEYWRAKYTEKAVKYQSFGKDKGGQWLFRIENPDPHDLENTVGKMAFNRSLRSFVLMVTGADRIFISERDVEQLGLKRLPDEDDFTPTGEVVEGEFREVVETEAETEAVTKEPAKTEAKQKTQAKNKETYPWDTFIKDTQEYCIKLGWTKGKLGWSTQGNELLKMLENRYVNVKELKDLSDAQRRDLVNQLMDRVAAISEQVKPAQAAQVQSQTDATKSQDKML